MPRFFALVLALVIAAALPAGAATTSLVTLPDGLSYRTLHAGRGPRPLPGQTLTVNYTGRFPDGRKFDSSLDRHEPFNFVLGGHHVIPCWEEGVASMRVGERRELICPPALAYGERGAGGVIPPNATLHFDVELLGVK